MTLNLPEAAYRLQSARCCAAIQDGQVRVLVEVTAAPRVAISIPNVLFCRAATLCMQRLEGTVNGLPMKSSEIVHIQHRQLQQPTAGFTDTRQRA